MAVKTEKRAGLFGRLRSRSSAPAARVEVPLVADTEHDEIAQPEAEAAPTQPEESVVNTGAAAAVEEPATGAPAENKSKSDPAKQDRRADKVEKHKAEKETPEKHEKAPADAVPESPVGKDDDLTVACKFCRRTQEVCRSRLRNAFEWSVSFLIVPYRCLYCGYRGFAFRFQVPKTPANQEILRESNPKR